MDRLADALACTVHAPAHRALCTDCGISRSSDPHRCGRACQFIAPDYVRLETRVHGRARDPARTDELHFGPLRRMVRASLRVPREGAQWSGITTRIAERLLETGAVDAVLTMAADPQDRWSERSAALAETLARVALGNRPTVHLESAGGSPTGAPTGPIVALGKLQG